MRVVGRRKGKEGVMQVYFLIYNFNYKKSGNAQITKISTGKGNVTSNTATHKHTLVTQSANQREY